MRRRIRPIVALTAFAVLGVGPALAQATPRTAPMAPADPQAILHILDYVAVDYAGAVKDGKVTDQGEYDEQVEFVAQARALIDRLPPRPAAPRLAALAEELVTLVEDKRSAEHVAARAGALRQAIIEAHAVEVSPRRPPDLRAAATLYAAQCALCHGAEGRGDGPAGRALDPRPASFHDRERLAQQSVYGLYSTITLGVEKTGMASFRSLPETDRWSLAFYVAGLGTPAADVARGGELWKQGAGRALTARAVASLREREVRARHGEDATKVLAFLRARPDALPAAEAPIELAARLLRESAEAYRSGRAQAAYDLAAASYLEGFELVEPVLDTVDRRLRGAVEAEMLRYRTMLRNGASTEAVDGQARAVAALLDEARERLAGGGLPPAAAFTGALVILLREGIEAILIVAAIVALLVKGGRRDALPWIHAGWIGALALGAVTWVAASYVLTLSGATREVTEGVTALAAAGVLLYVGFWMHSKAYATRWRAFLEERLGGALAGRTAWALALVSFLAVYREAFETVLFAEALWLHAGPGGGPAVLGGFAAAAGALGVIAWLVVRGGLSLPLGIFFGATSGLLALLAVIYAGQGVAALQSAGWLPLSPMGAPSLPLLLQVALLVVIAAGFLHTHRSARRAA